MCGICGHPGPQHAPVVGGSLPKLGEWKPICGSQCARCRQEVRDEHQRAESDGR
ncbi:hypothetical protein ACFVY4_26725 [Streptomyces sp. NPDC058299]|uniref:hypothetical protein n=1 Tax=Streptomyces sp. NPDC058299 TaxID=3346435 RepID=UPI0036EB1983